MPTASFLEGIYQGFLDYETMQRFATSKDTQKIQPLIDKFQEILKEYPASELEQQGRLPQEVLARMGEIGLFGISIPQQYGGLGFNLWEYLQVTEEMVKQDVSSVLVSLAHLSIGVKGILLFGTEAQKHKYLVPAASGDMIFSFALTEPRYGSDAQHIETSAKLSEDGTHYLLNGQKTYITNANYAGGLTVFAQLDPERPGFMGAFIVETAWEGVKVGKDMPKMGLKTSSTAAIQFKDVRVPAENLLGQPGDGFKIAMTVLNYGRLGLGASSLGMIDQSLADMKKRAASRIQFGVPIKDFPLIQEKLAKAKAHGFMISALNDFTAGFLEADPHAGVAMETSHCKLWGTTQAWDTLYDALQVAGGSGYIATQPYEKRMRDFRVSTVFEGTTEIHSMYPPLFMLRKMSKQLAEAKGLKNAQPLVILRNLVKRTEWKLADDDKVLRQASKLAKANAVSIRRLLNLGLLLYGKKIAKKQYLLRRINTLSIYLYGLLAAIVKLQNARKAGQLSEQDLDCLRYLIAEAKEARNLNKRFLDSTKERLTGTLVASLFQS